MAYLEELLPEFRKGAKIRCVGWSKEKYIHIPDPELGDVLDETGKVTTIPFWYTIEDFWEFYKEPEPDWDFIINNKCLCWFYDDNENGKYLGTIRFINKNDELPFMNWERGYAKHCRPVRRDEVTFYEDRKDE